MKRIAAYLVMILLCVLVSNSYAESYSEYSTEELNQMLIDITEELDAREAASENRNDTMDLVIFEDKEVKVVLTKLEYYDDSLIFYGAIYNDSDKEVKISIKELNVNNWECSRYSNVPLHSTAKTNAKGQLCEASHIEESADVVSIDSFQSIGGKYIVYLDNAEVDIPFLYTNIRIGSDQNSICFDQYRTLEKGDTGKDVEYLVERLIELGYLGPQSLRIYNRSTVGAIKRFQDRAGLEATGIADIITQEKLFAYDAPSYEMETIPTSKPTGVIVHSTPTPKPTATPFSPPKIMDKEELQGMAEGILQIILKNPESLQIYDISTEEHDNYYYANIDYSAMNGFGGHTRENLSIKIEYYAKYRSGIEVSIVGIGEFAVMHNPSTEDWIVLQKQY